MLGTLAMPSCLQLGCRTFSTRGARYANSRAGLRGMLDRIDCSALLGSGKDSRDPLTGLILLQLLRRGWWIRHSPKPQTSGAVNSQLSLPKKKCICLKTIYVQRLFTVLFTSMLSVSKYKSLSCNHPHSIILSRSDYKVLNEQTQYYLSWLGKS